MIIGLVLLALVAVLLFFGVAQRVFKSFGIAYWAAFVIVGLFIGSAFIPTFSIWNVKINVAGFAVPLVIGGIFTVLARKTRELWKAFVAMSAVTAMCIAVELTVSPFVNAFASAVIIGILCGAVAFVVGRTKLAALSAVFIGCPVGDIISSAVGVFTENAAFRLGSPIMFDALVLAAVFAVVLIEATAAIKRSSNAKRKALSETAEEFDPDEYKRYFDE